MRSGNLNFTVPLIKAMSRGGGGAAFNLSYNSQNWRQDAGGEWQLGRDIGYGYGWRLSAGALTPIYDSIWGLDHYEFTDSTGALYRLDQNINGIWSSKESIYLYYDPSQSALHFTNGSRWIMSCTSAGTEQDSGTMYPIWSSTLSGGNLTQTFYYYGTDGQKLGIYPLTLAFINGSTPVMTDNSNVKLSTFFGSKRIGTYDRLGTAKYNANGQPQSFFPYGEDRGTVQPNDSLKFATYTRDSATGLDYADQRYYANNFGRFMSPDPYKASAGLSDPGSWNRYAYVIGDPVNRYDPHGRDWCPPTASIADPGDPGDSDCCDPADPFCGTPGSGSGGNGHPPCWYDLGGVFDTLLDLGMNIAEITTEKLKSANLGREVVQLDSLIAATIAQEITTTEAAVLTGSPGPDFIGGHFNLFLKSTALQNIFGADFTQFNNIFGGSFDGARQGAVFGSAAQLNYTLHSKDQDGRFDFHFDIYNPLSGPVNLVKHFFVEVIGGHSGSPCLDPAWAK